MPRIQILAHLPRFRMEPDQVSFPLGTLVKLTWESYDGLTLGAFSDWKPWYDASDPVFLLVEAEADLPFVRPGTVSEPGMAEMKCPSIRWNDLLPRILGSPFLTRFHDSVVDVVWAALLLAVPGAAPAWPRTSVTLLIPVEGHVVSLGDEERAGIRIQGEADQEYIYSADTSCLPVTEDDLALAAGLVPLIQRIGEDAGLVAALRQLMVTTDVGLGPGDRLVLAVSALESLLLPEVRSGQQDAFAERITGVVGQGREGTARAAYRARSRIVHEGPAAVGPGVPAAVAEQLLADVLIASAGGADGTRPDPAVPRGRATDQRLYPRPAWVSGTVSFDIDLSPPAGQTVSWSPLIGLDYDGPTLAACGATLTRLSAAEIVSMEHKDIRRDFIAELQVKGMSVAGLAVLADTGDRLGLDDDLMRSLLRPRDLTVAGLRLAGVQGFVDPELLGWYVYQGALRHRRETVLRQTVLMGLGGSDAVPLDAATLATAQDVWALLAAYDARGADPDVDLLLAEFRRAHDPYLAEETRLSLLFAILEGLLGRFRPASAAIGLEDLVSALPGPDPSAIAWFAAQGRVVRNAVAHGAWKPRGQKPGREADSLRAICAAALRELLTAWDGTADPSKALLGRLKHHLEGGGLW